MLQDEIRYLPWVEVLRELFEMQGTLNAFFMEHHFYFKQLLTWDTYHLHFKQRLAIRQIIQIWVLKSFLLENINGVRMNNSFHYQWLYWTFQVKIRIFENLFPSPWSWESPDLWVTGNINKYVVLIVYKKVGQHFDYLHNSMNHCMPNDP